MKVEGQVRIPSGCAIAAVISKEGNRMSGEMIYNAMKPMHDRSNGLGGGFAGYGIYPEYRYFYALHMFFDSLLFTSASFGMILSVSHTFSEEGEREEKEKLKMAAQGINEEEENEEN